MTRGMRTVLVLGLFLAGLLPPCITPVEAAGGSAVSLGLAPVRTAVDLAAGEALTVAATCTNDGLTPLHVSVTYQDAVRRGEDSFEFQDPGQVFWSAGSWLKAEPGDFDIQPGEKVDLAVTVAIPAGTPDGEYYGACLVQGAPLPEAGGGVSTTINVALGSLFFVAVGDDFDRTCALVSYRRVHFSPNPQDSPLARFGQRLRHLWRYLVIGARNVAAVAENRPVTVFIPIENLGKTHIQPRAAVTISRGTEVQKVLVQEGEIILPGEVRVLELPWAEAPLYGVFRLDIRVDYGGSEPLTTSRTFVVVPVKAVLGLALFGFGLGYLAARRAQKRTKGSATPGAPA